MTPSDQHGDHGPVTEPEGATYPPCPGCGALPCAVEETVLLTTMLTWGKDGTADTGAYDIAWDTCEPHTVNGHITLWCKAHGRYTAPAVGGAS